MKHRSNHGFTLLELLVAVTLTLGIAAVMFTVTSTTLALWRRTQDTFTITSQAKLALDLFERDLHGAVFRPESTTTWLAASLANSTGDLASRGWQLAAVMKPATGDSLALLPQRPDGSRDLISRARFGVSGVWLRFITAVGESAGDAALPRAVAYQIARRPVSGTISATNKAEVRYSLYRSAIASDISFANGNDVLASAYGASLSSPSPSELLLTNVVDFGVWLYVRDSAGALRQIFPSNTNDLDHAARDPGGAADANRYPQVADVMVRVLSEDGARQIAALEQGVIKRPAAYASDAEWWWAVVEGNSSVYVQRVEIKGVNQ